MIRLDKYLCDCTLGSRSQVKEIIKKGQIKVNDVVIKKPEYKLEEAKDKVYHLDRELSYRSFHYYMLHKPAGIITATRDKKEQTVLDLLPAHRRRNLFPVGRLDKDTEGLLLLTDDGELAHQLLSPGKKVPKTYYVETKELITLKMQEELCKGVTIGENTVTRPAKAEILSPQTLHLTITEGKYHQVKRMFQAVGNEVTYLKRVSMGRLKLDPSLKKGEFRSLTEKEVFSLKNNIL